MPLPSFGNYARESVDTIFVIHYISDMKNVTITMDEDVAHWARVHAAEQNTSVSRLLGELLKQRMNSTLSYERAKEQFFAGKPTILKSPGSSYPDRGSLYERS